MFLSRVRNHLGGIRHDHLEYTSRIEKRNENANKQKNASYPALEAEYGVFSLTNPV